MTLQDRSIADRAELSAVERRRIVSLKEAARLMGVSVDTLLRAARKTGHPRIIQMSPRRVGCRLGEVLGLD
ncbi:MAG: hypothetical protein AB7U61_16420 [Methylocystis sp.]